MSPTSSVFHVDLQVDAGGAGSLVTGNEFVDPTPTAGENQSAIFLGVTTTVSDNSFEDLVIALFSAGGVGNASTISDSRRFGGQLSPTRPITRRWSSFHG